MLPVQKVSLNLGNLTDIILIYDKSIFKVTASSERVTIICSEACGNVMRYMRTFFHVHGNIIEGLQIPQTKLLSEKSSKTPKHKG